MGRRNLTTRDDVFEVVRSSGVASVYVETTIVSYLTARPSRDAVLAAHQTLTRDWWRDRAAYELRVSQLVIGEAAVSDEFQQARRVRALRGIPVLSLKDPATRIARELVRQAARLPAAPRLAGAIGLRTHR
ncbi:MAG: hypothetical protein AABO57_23795 [Acidobacteriota bacterium]